MHQQRYHKEYSHKDYSMCKMIGIDVSKRQLDIDFKDDETQTIAKTDKIDAKTIREYSEVMEPKQSIAVNSNKSSKRF